MPEFGSFCLLLALILTLYNFAVGSFALWGATPGGVRATGIPKSRWNRLGETAQVQVDVGGVDHHRGIDAVESTPIDHEHLAATTLLGG